MKNIFRMSMVSLFMICTIIVYSQKTCEVLKSSISGTYKGKCKNGLANGKGIAIGTDRYEGQFRDGLPEGTGTYTWADGSVYTGEWVEGLRQGIGKFTKLTKEKDSTQDGLWLNDTYMGAKPDKPNVTMNNGVERFSFKKSFSKNQRVLFDFYKNGVRNNKLTNFLISTSSGEDISYGILVGYDNVIFPVTIKISYTTMNKLNTAPNNVKFDFVIYEPGDWTVTLHN